MTAERRATKGTLVNHRTRRIAAVVDRGATAEWHLQLLASLASDPTNEIVLLIEREPPAPTGTRKRISALVWKVADALEGALIRVLGVGFTRQSPAGLRLDALPRASMERDRKAIEAAGLDIILDLSNRSPERGLAVLARYGAWSLRAAGRDAARPLGFSECLANEPICTVEVVALSGQGGSPAVVASGTYGCYRWSWSINSVRLARRTAWLIVEALQRAIDDKPRRWLPSERTQKEPTPSVTPVMALARVSSRALRDLTERLLKEDRWRVLLFSGTPDGRTSGPPTILEAPLDTYWADPFLVRTEGKCFVFFEEYLYAARRGVISYVEIDDADLKGGVLRPTARRLFDEPYHLSYPFLFNYQDALYMIPESSGNRTIELWKCVALPGKWRKVRNIMEGFRAVDSTLLSWNGKWWLFTNLDQSGQSDNGNELHLFYADDPIRGRWQPHPENPVVVDARRARMAGGFLTARDGQPVRCCQVQGKWYGEAVAYNLIEELSETRYREVPWRDAVPVPVTLGARTHHVNHSGGLVVADECRRTWRLARILGLSR